MLELPHMLIGAAIATSIGNPLLSLPLALGSHFVADLVPHWNPHIYRETKKYGKPTRRSTVIIIVDSTLSLGLGLFIASQALPDVSKALIMLAACLLAVLPDVVEAPFFYFGVKPEWMIRLINWQRKLQVNAPLLPGLAIQLVVVIVATWLIF